MSNETNNSAVLAQLAEVQGQLKVMTQLLMHQNQSTNQRLDDMRETIETRFDGVEKRLERVEDNERKTALVAAGTALMRMKIGG